MKEKGIKINICIIYINIECLVALFDCLGMFCLNPVLLCFIFVILL